MCSGDESHGDLGYVVGCRCIIVDREMIRRA